MTITATRVGVVSPHRRADHYTCTRCGVRRKVNVSRRVARADYLCIDCIDVLTR